MNGPRIRPLVWGSWPPTARPLETNTPAEKEKEEVLVEENYDQEPAAMQAEDRDAALQDQAGNDDPEENQAAPVKVPESPEMKSEEQVAEAVAVDVDSPAAGMESEMLGVTRPPVHPGTPYYPPGPPTGPYVPPGSPVGPHIPPQPPTGPYLPHMELARAYIPVQVFGPTYSLNEALEKGTLFPDLWRPYPVK